MTFGKKIKMGFCKLFGHQWTYYTSAFIPGGNFRCCKRCQLLQEWRIVNPLAKELVWSNLVEYRKKGARIFAPGYGK